MFNIKIELITSTVLHPIVLMDLFRIELYVIELLRITNRLFNLILNFVHYWT